MNGKRGKNNESKWVDKVICVINIKYDIKRVSWLAKIERWNKNGEKNKEESKKTTTTKSNWWGYKNTPTKWLIKSSDKMEDLLFSRCKSSLFFKWQNYII